MIRGGLFQVRETLSAFHRRAQRNAFCRRDARQKFQMVRTSASTAETQPQLHPVLPRLSAMICHYFMDCGKHSH